MVHCFWEKSNALLLHDSRVEIVHPGHHPAQNCANSASDESIVWLRRKQFTATVIVAIVQWFFLVQCTSIIIKGAHHGSSVVAVLF